MPTFTPNQAAQKTGLSRRSIMRAIEAGELDARRDNRNQWQINADSLAQWAPSARPMSVAQPAPTILLSPIHEMQARIAVLEAEITGMRHLVERADARALAAEAAIQDTRADRDRWHAQAERLAIPAPAAQGLLAKLFGRKVA